MPNLSLSDAWDLTPNDRSLMVNIINDIRKEASGK